MAQKLGQKVNPKTSRDFIFYLHCILFNLALNLSTLNVYRAFMLGGTANLVSPNSCEISWVRTHERDFISDKKRLNGITSIRNDKNKQFRSHWYYFIQQNRWLSALMKECSDVSQSYSNYLQMHRYIARRGGITSIVGSQIRNLYSQNEMSAIHFRPSGTAMPIDWGESLHFISGLIILHFLTQ